MNATVFHRLRHPVTWIHGHDEIRVIPVQPTPRQSPDNGLVSPIDAIAEGVIESAGALPAAGVEVCEAVPEALSDGSRLIEKLRGQMAALGFDEFLYGHIIEAFSSSRGRLDSDVQRRVQSFCKLLDVIEKRRCPVRLEGIPLVT